jgi:predicted ester cyclase
MVDLINRSELPTGKVIDFLASNVDYHRPGMADLTGLTEVRKVFELYRGGLPDQNGTVEDLIAEGDKAARRFSWRGTHQAR